MEENRYMYVSQEECKQRFLATSSKCALKDLAMFDVMSF